jgi:hypothetical protein
MSEAVEEMLLATTFRVSEGDIFVVSFTGSSPEEAQRVTAHLTDILIGENARLRSGQAVVTKEFLEAERKRNAAELAAKESEYVRFLAAHPEFLEDAAARGITLNLLRLFSKDEGLLQRVEESFAEAAEVARHAGIDLRLPATVPSPERRCEFIEEGSAFVSWDGDVHPCYFLWHRYQCFVGGSEKKVKPHSFGNLRERDIMEIWNGASFGDFRGEVVRYEYPFCHDCNAALCSDVRDEEVTDCHLGAVPCAACMWCTGVFQCLQ